VRGEVSPQADRLLQDGEVIPLGEGLDLRVLHTPGHTPGSICLLTDGHVLTGDTLLAGSLGRADLEESAPDDLRDSVEQRLLILAEDLIILPGHGPASTIGEEKKRLMGL